jgi:hypothetical protein
VGAADDFCSGTEIRIQIGSGGKMTSPEMFSRLKRGVFVYRLSYRSLYRLKVKKMKKIKNIIAGTPLKAVAERISCVRFCPGVNELEREVYK